MTGIPMLATIGLLMLALLLPGQSLAGDAQADRASPAAGSESARVVLRIEAWNSFANGDGIYRVLFSEVKGEGPKIAPPQKAPPNAFEMAFLPGQWPEAADDFYRFDFDVKPATYAVTFVFWADQTGETTAVGQSVTNSESLLFTVEPGATNYLGDLRLRFDDMQGRATQVIRHTGHGLGSGAEGMREVAPEIAGFECPDGLLGASRRTCMRAAMEGQKNAAPEAVVVD